MGPLIMPHLFLGQSFGSKLRLDWILEKKIIGSDHQEKLNPYPKALYEADLKMYRPLLFSVSI